MNKNTASASIRNSVNEPSHTAARATNSASALINGVLPGPWNENAESHRSFANGEYDYSRRKFTLSEDLELWKEPLTKGTKVRIEDRAWEDLKADDVCLLSYIVRSRDPELNGEPDFLAAVRPMSDSDKAYLVDELGVDPDDYLMIDRGHGREMIRNRTGCQLKGVISEVFGPKGTRKEVAESIAFLMRQEEDVIPDGIHQALWSGMLGAMEEAHFKNGYRDTSDFGDLKTVEEIIDICFENEASDAA